MTYLTSLFAGLLFGLGLIVSGMVNPGKVQSFLDLAGAWDPSLMLVMGGAIAVGLVAFTIAKKRAVTFIGEKIDLPHGTKIDVRLVAGSALFGIGWGLAGFCPGPALVGAGMGLSSAFIFVAAMIAGMLLFELIEKVRRPK
ncbi:DUF6691 family protein [Undibacterium sp. RuRC25W]|uniref:DUF6691 family protein n=1 Tax=Undibacterium sp. RuRC25W TaxID=3413047 RepID=UPI003BF11AA5